MLGRVNSYKCPGSFLRHIVADRFDCFVNEEWFIYDQAVIVMIHVILCVWWQGDLQHVSEKIYF